MGSRAKHMRLVLCLVAVGCLLMLLRRSDRGNSYAAPTHTDSHLLPTASINSQQTSWTGFINRTGDGLHNVMDPFPNSTLQCRDKICSNFLTGMDDPHFKYCWRKTGLGHQEPLRSTCRFVDGTNRSAIGLASFPGSGNTWVRGLLQEITGLCTGGIYCDVTLRARGYPGECIRSGVVLVVKTHQTDPRWTGVKYDNTKPFAYFKKVEHIPVYGSAILLIRNPFHALVSEWHREQTVNLPDNHVKRVGREYFGENREWSEYVHQQGRVWRDTALAWTMLNRKHPVVVFQYEDLLKNTEERIRAMLQFLRVPYKEVTLRRVVESGYEEFRREHHNTEEFEHFTKEQRSYMQAIVTETIKLFRGSKDFASVADMLIDYTET